MRISAGLRAAIAGTATLFLIFVLAAAARAANPAIAEAVTIETPRFTLAFTANGRPASLRTRADGREWLNAADPGAGLYLETRDGARVPFIKLSLREGKLIATGEDGLPRITFAVHPRDTYIALRIERMEAVPASREVALRFEMNIAEPIGLLELDYMTDVRVDHPNTIAALLENPIGSPVKVDPNALGKARVNWLHIWNRNAGNPLGGFALYCPASADDEDETILNIWADEQLPHPKVEGPWTREAARAYVERWTEQHNDPSRFWIQADTPQELNDAVPYAVASGARDVYLFTDTWRGEAFWAREHENWHVNRKVFPRGEADLRAFSDTLAPHGMQLKMHWISGGIGLEDRKYIGKAPDARLASWGRGELTRAAGPEDKTLYFKPAAGTTMPFRMPMAEWFKQYGCPPMLQGYFDYEIVQIGNELVKVGAFENTDREVWRLENCERGLYTTDPASHAAGDAARGLITTYGSNFIPDNDSTLLEEMAKGYADFLARVRSPHTEYDGGEIHTYDGRMWGYHKFSTLVYQNLAMPTSAFSSNGLPPPCYLEHRLNATRNLLRDRLKGIVAVMLDEPAREASNLLDAHWGLSQMCAHGFNFYNIQKPEPLFGINVRTLRDHGQTSDMLRVARQWKRVNTLITPEQRTQIRDTMFYASDTLDQMGNHKQSKLIHVLEPQPAQERWAIYPSSVLARPGSLDILWQDGQEHGTISPHQYLQPETTMTLVNPQPAQAPRLVMRVLWGFDTAMTAARAEQGQGGDVRSSDWFFQYDKIKHRQTASTGTDPERNILLQPRLDEIRNRRDTTFTAEGDALVLAAANPLDQAVWNEHQLPEWSRTLDMRRHRGIGAWVTGDGSGATLVIQVPGADYAVPIDFTGRRWIEIPNNLVAWAQGCWGWRMGSKHAMYENVPWVKMGFGMLPPRSQARVSVEGLTALREQDSQLVNPVLRCGDARLTIKGSIPSGHYVTWDGAPTCTVFDANWRKTAELPVEAAQFTAPAGEFTFGLEADPVARPPWIELALLTRGEPILVPDADMTAARAPDAPRAVAASK